LLQALEQRLQFAIVHHQRGGDPVVVRAAGALFVQLDQPVVQQQAFQGTGTVAAVVLVGDGFESFTEARGKAVIKLRAS
jgi:hypothetical protein